MDLFAELYGCDSTAVANFFLDRLHVVVPDHRFAVEKAYGASILGHFAQLSRESEVPEIFADLSEIYDEYIDPSRTRHDAETSEKAGAQILLFAGFLQDQMRRRHKIEWYYQLGRSFYLQAGIQTPRTPKRALLLRVSEDFSFWGDVFCRLSHELRDSPYIIDPPKLPPTA